MHGRFTQWICSGDSRTLAPSPAESVSTPGQLANTLSAVGLRKRFWVQMNKARLICISGKLIISISLKMHTLSRRGKQKSRYMAA
jgi:hypothetical protein